MTAKVIAEQWSKWVDLVLTLLQTKLLSFNGTPDRELITESVTKMHTTCEWSTTRPSVSVTTILSAILARSTASLAWDGSVWSVRTSTSALCAIWTTSMTWTTRSPDSRRTLPPGIPSSVCHPKYWYSCLEFSVEMTKRSSKTNVKIQSRGIFVGARVVRGYDWDWANQDGTKSILILLLFSYFVSSHRRWRKNWKSYRNKRLGYRVTKKCSQCHVVFGLDERLSNRP